MNISKNTQKRTVLIVLFAILIPILAFAEDGWETCLTVSVLQGKNKLYFGQRADASDEIDGKYDAPAMLAGGIKASFSLPEGAYWRDIKSLTGHKTWRLHVESTVSDTIYLRWKQESLPKNRTIQLIDVKGAVLADMAAVSEYHYVNDGARDFLVEAGEEAK